MPLAKSFRTIPSKKARSSPSVWDRRPQGSYDDVVAPLLPEADWAVVKPWARAFAEDLAAEFPNDFTATMSKARRRGRIFIDWLRNQRGATAVMPFSVRAREGAGVAVPIDWSRLADIAGGNAFSAADPAAILAAAKTRRRVKSTSLIEVGNDVGALATRHPTRSD